MKEWLKPDGTVLADDGPEPREWPPQGCCWEAWNGGPWVAIGGRIPLCKQLPQTDAYGCRGQDCKGCRMAGIQD